MPIDQTSISANLAATGQIGGQPAQPGQRGPLGVLPGLSFQSPFTGSAPKLFAPPQSPFASFLSGGAFNKKGNGLLAQLAKCISDDLAKCNAGGATWMQMATYGVQSASANDVGHGLARIGPSASNIEIA